MALGFYFAPQSFSKEQYDEVLHRLEVAAKGAPSGPSLPPRLPARGEKKCLRGGGTGGVH